MSIVEAATETDRSGQHPERLGYRHPAYAASLASYGSPLALPDAGAWVLERSIPGSGRRDAMSLYPFLACRDWHRLPDDIDALQSRHLVSLVLVSDPMLPDADRAIFSHFELVRPFKDHYLCDLSKPDSDIASRHHRYYARRAARQLEIDVAACPGDYVDEWCDLYSELIARHAIADLRRFSRVGFETLLGMPGVLLLRALRQGRPVGAQIIVLHGEVAHAHLAVFTSQGYLDGASYLLDRTAQEHLRPLVRYLNWGGGGARPAPGDGEDGLASYKRGWSTERRSSYLLGRVFDPAAYRALSGPAPTSYFPAYRSGEFTFRNAPQ